jgi:hypothetical protein
VIRKTINADNICQQLKDFLNLLELIYKWLWEDLKPIFALKDELNYAGFLYWR